MLFAPAPRDVPPQLDGVVAEWLECLLDGLVAQWLDRLLDRVGSLAEDGELSLAW